MIVPRWIKDNNPDESIEDRILNILYAVQNGFTKDGHHFSGDRELLGWIASELNSLWQKTIREKES